MKTNKYIKILLDNGLNVKTISKLNESQMRVLAEKMSKNNSDEKCPCGCEKDNCPCGPDCKKCDCGKGKKKETKEATTKTVYDPNNSDDAAKIAKMVSQVNPNATIETPKETTESQELDEKFKSKAQQKLFFMKCGDGKTKEQKKWCKLRDEFASDTTKRDYKTMPDHVDDEKPTSKKRRSTKKESYEKQLEDKIVEMIDNHINPAMTKGKLIKTINEKKSESFILRNPKKLTMFSNEEGIESKGRRKKMEQPIGRITSLGMMDEDTETAPTPTKDPKTKPGTKNPGRRNPFKKPGPKEKPRAGENEKQKSDFMLLIKQVLNIS